MQFTEHYLTGTAAEPEALVDGQRMRPEVAEAFSRLAAMARDAGFDLAVASGYRPFARQLAIWNGKLCGRRPVLDEHDRPLDLSVLSVEERLEAVLRFSALPGASRHHWGTDIDVFDRAAVGDDYRLQLSAAEVAADGVFAPLHSWLDERIARGESFGFYRPYGSDHGGVAPERWHLSYAPLAGRFAAQLTCDCLRRCWRREIRPADMQLQDAVTARLDALFERYVLRVDPPPAALLSAH